MSPMENVIRHPKCPLRHENGNCLPHGGFCTAVNEYVCDAMCQAYDAGRTASSVRQWSHNTLDQTIIVEGNWTIESAIECLQNCGWMQEHDNEAHNEGYDVGYWAGRRDYEKKWIPCNERLPEKIEPVNITWVNHDPSEYYQYIKDVPLTATGVHCNGKWFWDSVNCSDYCKEYGASWGDEMDEAIEVIAWMPLPEPYKAERRKE